MDFQELEIFGQTSFEDPDVALEGQKGSVCCHGRQVKPLHRSYFLRTESMGKFRYEVFFGGTLGSAGAVPADLRVSCAFQKPPRSLVFYGIAFCLLMLFYHPHPSMSLRVYLARLPSSAASATFPRPMSAKPSSIGQADGRQASLLKRRGAFCMHGQRCPSHSVYLTRFEFGATHPCQISDMCAIRPAYAILSRLNHGIEFSTCSFLRGSVSISIFATSGMRFCLNPPAGKCICLRFSAMPPWNVSFPWVRFQTITKRVLLYPIMFCPHMNFSLCVP